MAQRIYREATPEVRKRQSEGMKAFHASRDIDSKRASAQKQSDSMKRYWAGIPSQKRNKNTEE